MSNQFSHLQIKNISFDERRLCIYGGYTNIKIPLIIFSHTLMFELIVPDSPKPQSYLGSAPVYLFNKQINGMDAFDCPILASSVLYLKFEYETVDSSRRVVQQWSLSHSTVFKKRLFNKKKVAAVFVELKNHNKDVKIETRRRVHSPNRRIACWMQSSSLNK